MFGLKVSRFESKFSFQSPLAVTRERLGQCCGSTGQRRIIWSEGWWPIATASSSWIRGSWRSSRSRRSTSGGSIDRSSAASSTAGCTSSSPSRWSLEPTPWRASWPFAPSSCNRCFPSSWQRRRLMSSRRLAGGGKGSESHRGILKLKLNFKRSPLETFMSTCVS